MAAARLHEFHKGDPTRQRKPSPPLAGASRPSGVVRAITAGPASRFFLVSFLFFPWCSREAALVVIILLKSEFKIDTLLPHRIPDLSEQSTDPADTDPDALFLLVEDGRLPCPSEVKVMRLSRDSRIETPLQPHARLDIALFQRSRIRLGYY